MSKRRSWRGEESTANPAGEANNAQLVESLLDAGIPLRTSVQEGIERFGGTKALAEMLVDMGFSSGKNPVRNMQRNLQRYSQFERTGQRSVNARPAPGPIQKAITTLARKQAIEEGREAGGEEQFVISLKGKISVNGYTRDRGIKEIFYDDEDFYDLLDEISEGAYEDAWSSLADHYGVRELHGLDFSFNFQ